MARKNHVSVIAALLSLSLVLIVSSPSSHAQVVRQLTDEKTSYYGYYGTLDDAGSVVFINSSTDQFGVNPNHAFQLLRFDPATGNGSSVTDFDGGISNEEQYAVSVSDDGQWVAFLSRADLTGENHDRSAELFVMRDDGTQLTQLTNDPAPNSGSVLGIAMAGAGGRIAFVSAFDPLGTNPNHNHQLFVINRDGTGLAQLTQLTEGEIPYFDISDDGQRLAFSADGDPTGGNADDNYEIFAIDGDGTNLRQLTSTTSGNSEHPVISGDGSTIAFHSYADHVGSNPNGQLEVFAIDWNGSNLRQLTQSTDAFGGLGYSIFPSITDDGQFVFFASNHGQLPNLNLDGSFEVWKIESNGTGLTPVTTYLGGINYYPVVSGSGNRLSFVRYGSPCEGPSGPSSNRFCAIEGNGNNAVQLILGDIAVSEEPDITPDGTRIVFVSHANLTGGDTDNTGELYVIEPDGSNLSQVTNIDTGGRPDTPSIAADGNTIVYSHSGNDLGTNPEINEEIFRIYADGTGLLQLTSTTSDYSFDPVISSDGSVVVFYSNADHTGGNTDGSYEVFKVNPDGTGVVQLTSSTDTSRYSVYPRVDQSGTWVTFTSNADLTGGNADRTLEIFRVRSDGSGIEQLTNYPSSDGFSAYSDISGSGELIVFISNTDPVGTNPERNQEVFLYNTTTSTTQQLTVTTEGDSYWPRISDNGEYVYFNSDSPFTEEDPDDIYHVFRVAVGTGAVERVGGLGFGDLSYPYALQFQAMSDGDGDRAVFSVEGDFTGGNPDFFEEIWVIDRSTPAQIEISSGPAPTVVSWDVEPGPIRYDVIRGDVANLQPGGGGTIDLGAVVCLEDDSPDADTIGFEDLNDPASGQVYFFVYRGSEGLDAGSGSYGRGSDSSERVAGSGDCQP